MVSRVKRYFLVIRDFSKTVDLNLPENFQIILDDKDNFHLNRFFYKQIGVDHYWRDRLLWSDSEWVKYVTNKNLCVSKVKEEIHELIESVEKDSNKIHEATDVIYHLMVYLEANNIKIEDVMSELKKRQK